VIKKHFSRAAAFVGMALLATLSTSSPAQAQDAMQQVKTLYASAAYEDALSALARLQAMPAMTRKPEHEQYRVFCLVALGRTVEAEKAIAAVVTEDPSFQPDAAEMSPRIQQMFRRVRRTLVPEIAQRMYLQGRGALDRKDKEAAVSTFAALVALIDSTAKEDPRIETEEPMLAELRLLASGFLDLTRAIAETKADVAPDATLEARPERTRAAALPAPRAEPMEITSPVPVKQDLPVWMPPDQLSRREFKGAIRVFISDAGRVTGAEVSSTIHPAYDRQLLMAAKTWEYQPALKDGVPIASEKLIEVVLKPR
jgi:hypothetical protein